MTEPVEVLLDGWTRLPGTRCPVDWWIEELSQSLRKRSAANTRNQVLTELEKCTDRPFFSSSLCSHFQNAEGE